MGVVIVNGTRIEIPDGANFSIINDVVHINGIANNDVGNLRNVTDLKITIEGRLGSVRADRGSITCENVEGHQYFHNGSVRHTNISTIDVTNKIKDGKIIEE